MPLREFLGDFPLVRVFQQSLTSNDVIDLLECFDLDVVYNFDRLHEGTSDSYSVSSHVEGFELRFDEHKILETIWCYITPRGDFQAIDADCIGVQIPDSLTDARRHAKGTGFPFKDDGEEGSSAYVRIDEPERWVHYEFHKGHLTLVTIMRPWD
jgi:hypothetical protein